MQDKFEEYLEDCAEAWENIKAIRADERKRFLKKVTKYLRENIMLYYYSKTFDEQEKWFEDFRKAMEE